MYAITGISGQVGGEVARTLLSDAQAVRAVVRDARKGQAWKELGCDLAIADMSDVAALTQALRGAAGAFVLLPPIFDPSPGFPESRATIAAIRQALEAARPDKVVCISTVGAQAKQESLLTQLTIMEQSLGELPIPVTFLRPAWFMENCRWDIASARERGVIESFLQPIERAIPMVATADVGRVAAELLREAWSGVRVVELEGPARVSPERIAKILGDILGRDVRAQVVPRESWAQIFQSQGMIHPEPRMQMIDGFNKGWITFENDQVRKGVVPIEDVLSALIAEMAPSATSHEAA
ncbi:MAG: NmrA family transcriptional regulator [Phycisphaerales bacterium]|nr:NmrA family transcriptional regulator [Phycisphaerales bacterium]